MNDVAESFAQTLKNQMVNIGDQFGASRLIAVHPKARERNELTHNLDNYIQKINLLGSEKYELVNVGSFDVVYEIRRTA